MYKKFLIGAGSAVLTLGLAFAVRGQITANAAANTIYTFETKAQKGPGSANDDFSIEVGVKPGEQAAETGSQSAEKLNQKTKAQPKTEASNTTAKSEPESQAGTASKTEAKDVSNNKSNTEDNKSSNGSITTKNGYKDGDLIGLDQAWKYADFSAINSGKAVMYTAKSNRRNKVVAVNAGHGTKGGNSVKTYCHPDKSPKVTGGTTAKGAVTAVAVSSGMTFKDGTPEAAVTLRMAQILKDKLISAGYDVLMIRDGEDVQLDNVARTVIANNTADIHIALHWDGDGLDKIKGVFFMSVPDGLKKMEPVSTYWQQHEALGASLIEGLKGQGIKIWGSNPLDTDLTQTSFSTIPSVDIELGNQCSDHSDSVLKNEADGLMTGINSYFGF